MIRKLPMHSRSRRSFFIMCGTKIFGWLPDPCSWQEMRSDYSDRTISLCGQMQRVRLLKEMRQICMLRLMCYLCQWGHILSEAVEEDERSNCIKCDLGRHCMRISSCIVYNIGHYCSDTSWNTIAWWCILGTYMLLSMVEWVSYSYSLLINHAAWTPVSKVSAVVWPVDLWVHLEHQLVYLYVGKKLCEIHVTPTAACFEISHANACSRMSVNCQISMHANLSPWISELFTIGVAYVLPDVSNGKTESPRTSQIFQACGKATQYQNQFSISLIIIKHFLGNYLEKGKMRSNIQPYCLSAHPSMQILSLTSDPKPPANLAQCCSQVSQVLYSDQVHWIDSVPPKPNCSVIQNATCFDTSIGNKWTPLSLQLLPLHC